MKQNNKSVKIIPLGGLEQIGMNITAFEYEDSIIVVDCGLAFPEDEMLGIDLVIPDVTYLKAKQADFRDQYVGKNADSLTVTKTGASEDNEIDAISGATVTSNAVTNAVNAALYYLHNCMN